MTANDSIVGILREADIDLSEVRIYRHSDPTGQFAQQMLDAALAPIGSEKNNRLIEFGSSQKRSFGDARYIIHAVKVEGFLSVVGAVVRITGPLTTRAYTDWFRPEQPRSTRDVYPCVVDDRLNALLWGVRFEIDNPPPRPIYFRLDNEGRVFPIIDRPQREPETISAEDMVNVTADAARELGIERGEGGRYVAPRLLIQRHREITSAFKAQRAATGALNCEGCGVSAAELAEPFNVPESRWTRLFDAHHIVPIREGWRITRMEDLRLLCPNCHRATHAAE